MIQEFSVERQILSFLEAVVEQEKIDFIVCSERKANAILRALIQEIAPPRFQWDWKNVISSTAVSQYAWDSFKGHRVLLFDELIHHGNTLRKHETLLKSLVPEGVEVTTAGFAVWEKCCYHPKHSYYAAVDNITYYHIRNEIIAMLQDNGSLLLDTEHIELTIRLQCGVRDFFDELARSSADGNSFSFVSGRGRINLTIEQPDILDDATMEKYLLPGSIVDDVVRKVRILERTHDTFSILPIFYPTTRCVPSQEWVDGLPQFFDKKRAAALGREPTQCKELFYMVGLLGGIELLRGTISALHDLRRSHKIIVEVPEKNFKHLATMFPTVNIELLWAHVKDLVSCSELVKPKRSKRSVRVINVDEEKLLAASAHLLCLLVDDSDNFGLEGYLPKGWSWKEMMTGGEAVTKAVDLDPHSVTVVTDRLIDSGNIVTDVEIVSSTSGEPFAVRTFAPEGEIVTGRVRRQMMVKAPACLTLT